MAKGPLSDTRIIEVMRQVNASIGVEAFNRIHNDLPDDVYDDFCRLLCRGQVDLHRDGYRGFTAELSDSTFSNAGFDLRMKNEPAH